MRILICDDDLLIINELKKCLQIYFKKNHLKCPEIITYESGEELLCDHGSMDIVFLDIEMPGVSGIYAGKKIKTQHPDAIIFILTSYIEYLDDAMRFHVFRYLSKPLDRQRLFRNMKDALVLYSTVNTRIPIETKSGIHLTAMADIICIEAISKKLMVYTCSGEYQSVHNMKWWTEELPANIFFQTHRSFIVNFGHVTDFDHSVIHLYNNSITAYLTRRKYTQFKEAYLLFLEATR